MRVVKIKNRFFNMDQLLWAEDDQKGEASLRLIFGGDDIETLDVRLGGEARSVMLQYLRDVAMDLTLYPPESSR